MGRERERERERELRQRETERGEGRARQAGIQEDMNRNLERQSETDRQTK